MVDTSLLVLSPKQQMPSLHTLCHVTPDVRHFI